MHQRTLKKYQTRATNFYRAHCGTDAPGSAQICAALLAQAPTYCPNSFSTLKSALAHDQIARGNPDSAKAIRQLVNPVTAPGSTLPRKSKPKKVCSVSDDDFWELILHLRSRDFHDEAVCVVLAYYLGVRPCEMRTITVIGNQAHVVGGKKSAPLQRGADRALVIEQPAVLKAVAEAAQWMSKCVRTDTAIRDRLRKECRTLWPRRKRHPTLKSFRHQMGSNLKASGETGEVVAYIMGHQTTESVGVYGDRRCGDGLLIFVRTVAGANLTKVRKPKKPARFGRGQVIGRIEVPAALAHRETVSLPQVSPESLLGNDAS